MNVCFSASRLMKAKEVREFCQQVRENQLHLMVIERQAKQKLREMQQEKRPARQR